MSFHHCQTGNISPIASDDGSWHQMENELEVQKTVLSTDLIKKRMI